MIWQLKKISVRQERLLEKPYPPVSANMTGKSPTKFTKWLFKWENKRKDLEVPPRHRNADPARSGESGAVTEKQKIPLGNTIIVKRQGCNIHICTVLYYSTCYEMSYHVQGCMDAWMDGCFKFQHMYSHHNWAPGQEDQGSPHLPQNRAHLGHVDHLPPG